jgi:hypothetical protein
MPLTVAGQQRLHTAFSSFLARWWSLRNIVAAGAIKTKPHRHEEYSRGGTGMKLSFEHRFEGRVVSGEHDSPELEGNREGLPVHPDHTAKTLDATLHRSGARQFQKDAGCLSGHRQDDRVLPRFELKK